MLCWRGLRLIGTLNWHQGPTHSLILLPLWAWLLAWLASRLTRICPAPGAGAYRYFGTRPMRLVLRSALQIPGITALFPLRRMPPERPHRLENDPATGIVLYRLTAQPKSTHAR
ncbi:MAG: hypothetical protein DU481_00255 [Nitrosomonas sp.]